MAPHFRQLTFILAALLLATGTTSAGIVEFDHIGELPSPYTGNLNGLFIYDSGVLGHDWRRSGVRWQQSQTATLETASFIVFIASPSVSLAHMQNNLAVNVHFWSGYEDSFKLHPSHGDTHVQFTAGSFPISTFTKVGPTGTEFQTFKITFDFTQLLTPIILNAGQEYVMAPVGIAGGQTRLSVSNPPGGGDALVDVAASGTNDATTFGPVLIDTIATPQQFAASLTVVPVPEPASWMLAAVGAGPIAIFLRRRQRAELAQISRRAEPVASYS